MDRNNAIYRRAFTLIELMVVISIIYQSPWPS